MLHPRNRHQGRYNFGQLIKDTPELDAFTVANPYGDQSIDFTDAAAVKMLNCALLKTFYCVHHWDIPDGYLCPPIPGRADYVHYLADLLARNHGGVIPHGPTVRVLDIGTGANMIYPLIGHHEYGWRFVGSEIDRVALASAQTIIQSNSDLASGIELRRQSSPVQFFKGIVHTGEKFDLTLCNPPFHASQQEALRGSQRKWRGLGKASPNDATPVRNFGGQGNELWCEGGEATFIRRMIKESAEVRSQIHWFSTLVSKESNLSGIYRALKAIGVLDIQTVEMLQGQKQSRFVAWTFFPSHTSTVRPPRAISAKASPAKRNQLPQETINPSKK